MASLFLHLVTQNLEAQVCVEAKNCCLERNISLRWYSLVFSGLQYISEMTKTTLEEM